MKADAGPNVPDPNVPDPNAPDPGDTDPNAPDPGDTDPGPAGSLASLLTDLAGPLSVGNTNSPRLGAADTVPDSDMGLDTDELALRRLLHTAVGNLGPSDGTLDHLRKAVPIRRARRRQAIVGMAAAALLFGTAIPAFVHVAGAGGPSPREAVAVGHGEVSQNSTGFHPQPGDSGVHLSTGRTSTEGDADKPPVKPSRGATADGKVVTGGTSGSVGTTDRSTPACTPAQLTTTVLMSDTPNTDGSLYGTFQVANASTSDCLVSNPGKVSFQAEGAADPIKITVLPHTVGDPATGLPAPTAEGTTVVLKPSNAYQVMFAWIPSAPCPTDTPSDPATPTDTPTAGPSGGATSDNSLVNEPNADGSVSDPTVSDVSSQGVGSVVLTLVTQGGMTGTQTTIPNACTGTVYWAGPLSS